jgi:uncharacterized membrane protein (UPF0127 family)
MQRLKIEVADTPDKLSKGLMFRDSMPKDEGMLFKFPMMTEASFWGKNTYIPLDVAFVGLDNKISSIKSITPMSTRMIHSDGLCRYAIEANAGFFKDRNIEVGSQVEFIKNDKGNDIEIVFHA